jgi:hypothetical protein
MHNFKRYIIFFIPLILIFCFLEYKLSLIPNSYNTKFNQMIQQANSIEILSLGSSHEYYGINPLIYPIPGYNLANTSQDLRTDLSLLKKYLPSMKKLKTLIIPISYFSLWYNLDNPNAENWRTSAYVRFFHLLPDSFNSVFNLSNYSLTAFYTPKTVLNYVKDGFKIDGAKNINSHGAYQINTVYYTAFTENEVANRINTHHSMMSDQVFEKNIRILNEIITLAKSYQITPVFMTLPVYETYLTVMNQKYYQKMVDTILSLTKKYSIKYHNYTYDPRFKKQIYFYDNDHLNTFGSEYFSKILYQELSN